MALILVISKKTAWLREIYGKDRIDERHRHRYAVNINFRDQLEKAGLIFSGLSPDGQLPEIVERKDHPHVYWRAIFIQN